MFFLSNVTFSIVSPFIPKDNVANNVEKLAHFRSFIQDASISLYQIVGQWQAEDLDTYSIDKGFLLIKPKDMAIEIFTELVEQSMHLFGQDAFALKSPGENLKCVDKDGNLIKEFSEDLSINMLGRAYACRLPIDKSFSLKGAEIPNGSIGSFQLFKGTGVEYYLPEDFFERKVWKR
jgi:hypothetical protein